MNKLKQAVEAARGEPVEIVDPERNQHYVLIRAEEYDRLQSVMDEGTRFALREMGRRAGWDDPSMDAYDALDPRKE
ncbi:MAG: hypothetical protein HYX69_02035 [Planctomycetia bacterium]|nr:hypothetical protein [Planctomycetia bacterium]